MQSYPSIFASFHQSLSRLLRTPYGEQSDELANIIVRRVAHFLNNHEPKDFAPWSEQDIYLITNGDSLTEHGKPPLKVLSEFLGKYIRQLISTVHILPYFPYSSDDGFSIIDYLQVNPALPHPMMALACAPLKGLSPTVTSLNWWTACTASAGSSACARFRIKAKSLMKSISLYLTP